MAHEIRKLGSWFGETVSRTLSLETAVRTFRREVRDTTSVGDAVRRGVILPPKLAVKMTAQQVAPTLMAFGEDATDLKEKFGQQGWESSKLKSMLDDATAAIISPGYWIAIAKIGAFAWNPLAFVALNFFINGVVVATKESQESQVTQQVSSPQLQ